jgi:hypothetical protein
MVLVTTLSQFLFSNRHEPVMNALAAFVNGGAETVLCNTAQQCLNSCTGITRLHYVHVIGAVPRQLRVCSALERGRTCSQRGTVLGCCWHRATSECARTTAAVMLAVLARQPHSPTALELPSYMTYTSLALFPPHRSAALPAHAMLHRFVFPYLKGDVASLVA